MNFMIPLNNMIGPSFVMTFFFGAVFLGFVAVAYRNWLQRQEDAWAKAGK